MKKFVFLLLVGSQGSAFGELTASKYGVVDMQAVILNVEEGKSARSDLEKEIKSKEADFQKKKEELDKLNKDWQSKAALLTEEARANKQKEFQEKFMQYRNDEMAFRDEIKRKEQKATQGIAIKVAGMVEKMASEKKLEIVFETNSAGLLYVQAPLDMTKEVIDRYTKEKPKTPEKSKAAPKVEKKK